MEIKVAVFLCILHNSKIHYSCTVGSCEVTKLTSVTGEASAKYVSLPLVSIYI